MRSSAAAKAEVFFALGDETRLKLVTRLSSGESQSIAQLTDGTDITRQAVTKHLRVLADAGLVRNLREGRESLWELQPRRLDEAKQYLDRVSAHWDAAIARLRAFVEE
jgi:DNA-binding transcriptional ArsR family regulator